MSEVIAMIPTLNDQGWVQLLDIMGDESVICETARICRGKDDTKVSASLIKNHLLANPLWPHSSPLEQVEIRLKIRCPLYIRSQWHRHRTHSYLELSRRVCDDVVAPFEFFNPFKPVTDFEFPEDAMIAALFVVTENYHKEGVRIYERMLQEGVRREIARGILSQNLMTEFYDKCNLWNLLKFLLLRKHPHAQLEMQEYGKAIHTLVSPFFPNVMEAFDSWGKTDEENKN